jgi:hypothetical protein
MATGRRKRGEHDGEIDPPRVVRRPPEERKRLPPELEAFARSDERRLRRPGPCGPKLKDPRPVALVPGVSNRDARAVHDARVERLRALYEAGDAEPALAEALAEAYLLGLWRGRALTGFGAMAVDVVGLPEDEAKRLLDEGFLMLGLARDTCRPELVAAWFRAEAALLEESHDGKVSGQPGEKGEPRLVVSLGSERLADAFHAMGRRMTPLVRDHQPDAQGGPRRPPDRDPG